MQEWLVEHGQQKFRAKQIFEWLYQKRVDSIDDMTNLSKDLRQVLKDNFAMTTLTTVVKQKVKMEQLNSYLNYKMAILLKPY